MASSFTCSHCGNPNTSGSQLIAGICSTCPDGFGLCEDCSTLHGEATEFAGHAFALAKDALIKSSRQASAGACNDVIMKGGDPAPNPAPSLTTVEVGVGDPGLQALDPIDGETPAGATFSGPALIPGTAAAAIVEMVGLKQKIDKMAAVAGAKSSVVIAKKCAGEGALLLR